MTNENTKIIIYIYFCLMDKCKIMNTQILYHSLYKYIYKCLKICFSLIIESNKL